MRTKLALAGIATAGLLTAGLTIATPAYAASVPADCTVQYQEFSVSMTCTARPATQVWNLATTCQVFDGRRPAASPLGQRGNRPRDIE